MILNVLLSVVLPVTFAGVVVGGIVVLAIVWKKICPVIIVKSKEGGKFFFGVSHSKKRKNMKKLTQSGVNGLNLDNNTVYGLANTPSKIIKEVGSVDIKKAQELLDSVPNKKTNRIEKRRKGIDEE